MPTTICDFARSFVTFRLDFERKPPVTVSHEPPFSLNNARIQLDCRCVLRRKSDDRTETFVLGASCKTERVGVDRDIWTQPNADFAPVFSADRFMHVKTFARAGTRVDRYPPGSGTQSDRQSGLNSDVFDDLRIDLVEVPGEELTAPADIVEAVLNNTPLVAVTEIESDDLLARIEYPVKTINASERHTIYQTDTGPVLFPDLSSSGDDAIERFELAYAAFNCREWCEFLVRERTPIAEAVEVYHYARPVRMDSTNRLLRAVP